MDRSLTDVLARCPPSPGANASPCLFSAISRLAWGGAPREKLFCQKLALKARINPADLVGRAVLSTPLPGYRNAAHGVTRPTSVCSRAIRSWSDSPTFATANPFRLRTHPSCVGTRGGLTHEMAPLALNRYRTLGYHRRDSIRSTPERSLAFQQSQTRC
jgi:hypothetical protein